MSKKASFILDLSVLEFGDIILKRSSSRISQVIRDRTKSEYSHAMLYIDDAVIIHSDSKGVSSRNAQREGVENEDDMVVLRVRKTESYDEYKLEEYARRMIGMEYDQKMARQLIGGVKYDDGNMPNRQFCTGFVARAYAEAGLHIVADAESCSPQDLLTSDKLERVKNAVRIATKEEQELVDEKNPIAKVQEDATQDMLKQIRDKSGQDIQTIEQLWEACVNDEEVDEIAYEVCKDHYYFQILDEYHNQHPEEYNPLLFITKYKNKTDTENAAHTLYFTMIKQYIQYQCMYEAFKNQLALRHRKTLEHFMHHYQRLVEDCESRMAVFSIFIK